MDPRERWDDQTEVIRTGVERGLGKTWTAMPVIVDEDTKDGHTTRLQPAIKGKQRDRQGKETDLQMPVLGTVPIHFASGGGYTITHPVKKGDEGIAVFGARCIDGWWDKGGVQPQLWQRRHHLSDAMYIPGIRSNPRKLGGSGNGSTTTGNGAVLDLRSNGGTKPVSLDTLQIRTDKGDVYIELTGDSVNIVVTQKVTVQCTEMDITATDKVAITSPLVTMSGDLQVGGQITAGADVHAGGDVHAGDSSGAVSLSWTQTSSSADVTTGQVQGILNVVAHAGTNVKAIGDNFTISGAISMAENIIPGGGALLNQAHQVLSIINSQSFTAALSALPGQLANIGGNPVVSAVVKLLSHDHHGVRGGPDISQQPVTGT